MLSGKDRELFLHELHASLPAAHHVSPAPQHPTFNSPTPNTTASTTATMLPTPETAPLHPTVYPPSEDTYLILDALTTDAPFLTTHLSTLPHSPLILELGPGSGMITSFLYTNASTLISRTDAQFLAIDANTHACTTTTGTVKLAPSTPSPGVFLDAVTGDLSTCLRPNVVDVMIFNPPYVPSPDVPSLQPVQGEGSYELESRLLALTYAGGDEGMEVTRRVLDGLERLLSVRGVAYVLLCKQNQPEAVIGKLQERGWSAVCVQESGKKGGWEKLSVWRIVKDGSP